MKAKQRIFFIVCSSLLATMNCKSPVGKHLSDYQIPAPTTFFAVPNAGSGAITLSWSEVDEADAYAIFRSTKDGDYRELASAAGANYVDSNLSSALDYYYLLVAKGDDNKRSTGLKAAMSLNGYPAPKGFACTDSGTNWVNLKWGKVNGAEGYRLFRSLDGSAFDEVAAIDSDSYNDSSLTTGTNYWYKVSAYGHGVEGKSSSILQVTPGGDNEGDENGPTGLTVTTRGSRSITLSWNATGEGHYSIYRSTDGGRTFTNCGGTQAQTVWTDSGTWTNDSYTPLVANTAYWYKVSSWSETGEWEEAFSSVISAKTLSQFSGSAVEAGRGHAVAIQDSKVWAWGGNWGGQVGDGTTSGQQLPTQVSGLSNVIEVSGGGSFTLALKGDGTVWAWGMNSSGQLGDGTYIDHYVPSQVGGVSGVVAISAGESNALALLSNGTVWGWGAGSATPVQITGLPTTATAIAAGWSHYLVLLSDGTLMAWGNNSSGNLGDGTTTYRSTPVAVSGLSSIVSIACGSNISLAVRSDGTAWVWGYNGNGQLGDGTTTDQYLPIQVSGLSNVKALSSSSTFSLAVTNYGTVYAWGNNGSAQLGDGTYVNRLTPGLVSGISSVDSVSCGEYTSYARKSDGSLWAWGSNADGRIGVGDYNEASVPTAVAQPE